MEGAVSSNSPFGILFFGVVFCALIGYVFVSLFKKADASKKEPAASTKSKSSNKANSSNKNQVVTVQKGTHKKPLRTAKHHQFSSPDLVSTFKGHTAPITSGAVSANGKGLVTASEDRTLFFYNLRDAFTSGAASIQGTRTNISFDHVVRLCWSPDYCAVLALKADSQALEVLKGAKKGDGTLTGLAKVREFSKPFTEPLVGLSVANNGKFIVTCDTQNQLNLWSLRGEQLTNVDTRQGNTLSAHLTLDDRFIITTGFTPDVKVFEVVYDKSDNLKALKKAFELTGHNSRVFCSHASPDSSKMVSVSKDGTWMLYDTSVDYQQGQSPRVLSTGTVDRARSVLDGQPCVVRLSPDSRLVLVAVDSSVLCYSASRGSLLHSINGIYAGPILDVFFDAGNQFFVTLGDQQAHLFHNVAGHHATIQDLEISLKAASYSGMRERIKAQLDTARSALQRLEAASNGNSKKSSKDSNSKKKN